MIYATSWIKLKGIKLSAENPSSKRLNPFLKSYLYNTKGPVHEFVHFKSNCGLQACCGHRDGLRPSSVSLCLAPRDAALGPLSAGSLAPSATAPTHRQCQPRLHPLMVRSNWSRCRSEY